MKTFNAVVLGLSIFMLVQMPLYAQNLMSVDKRSQKGKVDGSNTSAIAVHVEESAFKFAGELVSYETLFKGLDSILDTRTPDERTVHITADPAVPFSRIADVLKIGRRLYEDNFSIDGVPIKIVLDEPIGREPKPGPRFLRVSSLQPTSFDLNGKVHTEISLTESLKATFDSRTRRKVYIHGSKDIDMTVFVKVRRSTKYGELVGLLKMVQASGADPICVEIDWLKD